MTSDQPHIPFTFIPPTHSSRSLFSSTMPSGYTQLPVEQISPEDEMNAAFDNGSDDEDEIEAHHTSAAQTPLLAHSRSQSAAWHPLVEGATPHQAPSRPQNAPGEYDFEYDYPPPPGSPPRPSALALPNTHGNSNGEIPSFSTVPIGPKPTLLRRALGAILPSNRGYARVGGGPVGGGMQNDGVFGNVTAKPGGAEPIRGAQADGPNWTPEDAQKDGPPVCYRTFQFKSGWF